MTLACHEMRQDKNLRHGYYVPSDTIDDSELFDRVTSFSHEKWATKSHCRMRVASCDVGFQEIVEKNVG